MVITRSSRRLAKNVSKNTKDVIVSLPTKKVKAKAKKETLVNEVKKGTCSATTISRGVNFDPNEVVYCSNRAEWRAWLQGNHNLGLKEVWLKYFKKVSGEPRIPYDDAVEEAICFGWIDGIIKTVDSVSVAQRFTPRRTKSEWSELNKERARRLINQGGVMTAAGMKALGNALDEPFVYQEDVLSAIRASPAAWRQFEGFPEFYKRIRLAYIERGRGRGPEAGEFDKRLKNFIDKTAQGKTFGMLRPS